MADTGSTTSSESVERLKSILRLAQDRRVLRLGYKSPGEATTTEYLVEPYRLHRTPNGPALHGWQLEPAPAGRSPWRDFRLDRVTSVADGGRTFEPRIPVTAHLENESGNSDPLTGSMHALFHQWSERPVDAAGPAEEYYRQLETAMLDGQVTREEMKLAEELARRVEPEERKAVHARVFANVLNEVLQDRRIAHREELYLKQVRRLLSDLGWAP